MHLPKPGLADAYDAGILGCDGLSKVQLMLMILGSLGAIA